MEDAMPQDRAPTIAKIILFVAAAALAMLCYRWRALTGYEVAVLGSPVTIGQANVLGVTAAQIGPDGQVIPDTRSPLTPDRPVGEDGKVSTSVHLWKVGAYRLDVTVGGATSTLYVQVQPVGRVAWSALLLAIIAILLPYALGGSAGGIDGGWYRLLSEPQGGYSLSRVQMFVWFLPTAILYGALSLVQQGFVEITAQLALLLGLSGATAILGTASSPSAVASRASVAPDLRDIVNDWNDHGDLSRYQYLLLSVVGAAVMIVAFWRKLEMPTVPPALLYLVAGSQGTYLATKTVKAMKPKQADSGSEGTVPSSPEEVVPADS
jgi:hypothetical protein